MSLCREIYRRYASVALVLALVLIALPSVLNAQTAPKATMQSDDTVPKWELFVGYQWLNPNGHVPDTSIPPVSVKLPSLEKGFGTNLSYNFTKYLSLEGNYGVNGGRGYDVNAITVGPKATWRGEGVNFFIHTLLGYERLSATNKSNGIAAVLGGGMDLKLWKPLSLRVFEADYQWSRQNFAAV